MIEINKVTIKTFENRNLVDEMSLVLNSNDKLAIIGEEGNGKSTLIKCLYDKELISDYVNVEGSINKLTKNIGYLPQFLDEQWKTYTVQEFLLIKSLYDEIDYSRYERLYDIVKAFSKKKLNTVVLDSNQLISTLSGGEKVKIQLIKILMDKPEVLLLDEPTNDIDIETLEWLESYLNEIDIPIIFISHDETLLENCSNRILHLEQLKKKQSSKWTLENIGYKDYYESRIKKIEHQTQVAHSEKREHKKQTDKLRKVYQRVEHEQNVISRGDPHGARLLAKKMKAVKSMERRFENQEMTEIPEIEESINLFFENVSLANSKKVLDLKVKQLKINDNILAKNINLEIFGPEKVTIMGRNGVGKSTLIKVILESLKDVKNIKVGYFPQNYIEKMDFSLTPIEFLIDSVNDQDKPEAIVRNRLGSVKFTRAEMISKLSSLSGGQLAKVYLIKQILDKCNVLVMDEPTRNLSPLSNPVFRKIVKLFNGCIICVSHDRKYISEVSDVIYRLKENGLEKVLDFN